MDRRLNAIFLFTMQQENPGLSQQPSEQPQSAQAPQSAGQGGVNSWIDQRPAGGVSIEPPRSSFKKKLLLSLIGFIILGLGAAVYMVMRPTNGQGVDVVINFPDQLQYGVPTTLDVGVTNNSGDTLEQAQVALEIPSELIFIGSPSQKTVENRTVGDIESGVVRKESFMVMATGDENIVRQIKASVSYVPGTLSSRFEKSISKDLVLAPGGFTVSIAAPTKALSSEEFLTEITYTNNTTIEYDAVQLKLKYPTGFVVKSVSSSTLDAASSLWDLGVVRAGQSGKVTVKGFVVGQDNAAFVISGALSALIGEVRYDVAQGGANITLSPSPLSLQVALDGGNTQILSAGQNIKYRLTYTNNTQIALKDVIVSAKLVGEMFDLKSIKTEGALRASDNTIIWNASRIADLSLLAAGATGVVNFEIATKASYPITRLSSKNFTVGVKAQIESPTVPVGVATSKTIGLTEITNKMRGTLGFAATGYYRDATSGIANAGALPAGVGRPTQFTIHWTLKNTSTDVTSVALKAFLGPNVRYTGIYKSSNTISPFYNDRTQEITWSVPSITATQGILSAPVELVFQVELTPAADQVGEFPQLIGESSGSYTDMFTGEQLQLKDAAITTQLPDDSSVQKTDRSIKAN